MLVCIPLFAQGVTFSTETGYLNIDGSKIDLDYDNGEKEEIQRVDIRVNGEVVENGVESGNVFSYDGQLNKYKNVTLNVIRNGNGTIENVQKDLVRLETGFEGFFLDGKKIIRSLYRHQAC